MSSSILTGSSGVNPYRAGVLIGNYVEEMFGLYLKQKYGKLRHSMDFSNLSEKQECFI